MVTLSQALDAKKKLSPLAKQKGVTIGVSSNGSDYHVSIGCKTSPAPDDFPDSIDGVSVVVKVVGEAKAQKENP